MEEDIPARLERCERANRRLSALLIVCALLATAGIVSSCVSAARAGPSALRISELLVVDERSTVRVRIGGQLPDAVIRGKRTPRGDGAAGLLLYDSTGQERGGYVTLNRTGYVGLTLDSRDGQTAVFRADSAGTTTLRLWNRQKMVELRANADGARMNVLHGNQVVLQQPQLPDPGSSAACADLRALRSQHGATATYRACRSVMLGDACTRCLEREGSRE